MEQVEAFVTKLKDVRASLGIMVSDRGFQAGAKAVAGQNAIRLLTYAEADSTDWRGLFGGEYAQRIVVCRLVKMACKVRCGPRGFTKLPLGTRLRAQGGNKLVPIDRFVRREWARKTPSGPGRTSFDFIFEGFVAEVEIGDVWRVVERVHVTGDVEAREYKVTLDLGAGEVLQEDGDGGIVYRRMASTAIDWQNVIQTQRGRKLTDEQFKSWLASGPIIPLDASKTKRYIRTVVTHKR